MMDTYRIDRPRSVIRQIQSMLLEVAYQVGSIPKLTIDGIFGPETSASVSAFQEFVGLPKTGTVDFTTWNELYRVYLASVRDARETEFLENQIFPLGPGTNGHPVTTLQSQLRVFSGVYPPVQPPAVTGQYGFATQDAVRAMQRSYGMRETGLVSKDLWEMMQADYKSKRVTENGS